MNKKATFLPSLREVSNRIGVSYQKIYNLQHRPEFQKTPRGYNLKKIETYFQEQERIKEEEEREKNLLGAEEELLEKQIKLETARHKCRLLELQIAQKEGNLIDVNFILETRTKEISRMKKHFKEMIFQMPIELQNQSESFIREKLSSRINAILEDLAEFIIDNWEAEEIELEEENE